MAVAEIKVRVEREGLILRIYSGASDKLISTLDLKEYYGLSDDNAAYVLRRLDEKDKDNGSSA